MDAIRREARKPCDGEPIDKLRRPYEKPAIEELGSLAERTAGNVGLAMDGQSLNPRSAS